MLPYTMYTIKSHKMMDHYDRVHVKAMFAVSQGQIIHQILKLYRRVPHPFLGLALVEENDRVDLF